MYSELSEIFGFRSFRPYQEEIIRAILNNRDVFAVMPTGGGKSLCYQLPAYMKKGVCVVVSPLISLMKDQVDAARANGLRAGTLNSTITPAERSEVGAAVRRGELDLLYVSPERFNTDLFIERLKTIDLAFFAIDEAHCISEWGHDFRPDYLALSRIVQEFPNVPVAAFTATATPQVSQDIIERLGLRSPHLTRASFNRANLFYSVAPKTTTERQILEFLQERKGESGIVYRTTRKNVEATAAYLRTHGLTARPYHAGMSDRDRIKVQEAFRRDECPIIVATIAFGMGIDKPNVRFVVHADLPKNLEGYYQETGRAGRDGEPAKCLLLFGRQDIATLTHFANQIEDPKAQEIAKTQLRHMIQFAEQDGCRRAGLLEYFGEPFPDANCNSCDICCGEVERVDATIEAQKALSAIHRTGGHFGAGHITDILVGANTEKIRERQHNLLPTYGVGKEHDKIFWRGLIDALLAQGLVSISDQQYPTPKVTEEGWKVLRKQRDFQMIRSAPSKRSKKQPSFSGGTVENYSKGLFEQLRNIRMKLASAENVPPYVVFSDRSLREMAACFPTTPEQLLAISGVGNRKLNTYGQQFLGVISRYVAKHPEEYAQRPTPSSQEERKYEPRLMNSEQETLRLLLEGKTLEEIGIIRALKRSTVLSHVETLLNAGFEVLFTPDIAPDRLEQIAEWFRQANSWNLTPVVEIAAGQLSYEEARLARIVLKQRKNKKSGEETAAAK
ncbi:MAG: DNA helicase RecQ [Planctomycetaceae bacterium]|nr:DNA helicase RecQ [Planctomycetaceae bacterium]